MLQFGVFTSQTHSFKTTSKLSNPPVIEEGFKSGLKCSESVCLSDPWRELVPQSLSNKAEMPKKKS